MPIDTSSYYPEVPSSEPQSETRDETRDFIPSERRRETGAGPEPPEQTPTAPPAEEPAGPRWLDMVCNLLSWVFVPLLMPVYGIMLIFGLSALDIAAMHTRVVFTMVVFGFNVLIPMALFMMLKRLGMIDDIGLNGRKERLIPYIITIACLGATALFMNDRGAPVWVSMFFVGGAIAGVVNLAVNFFWKISAHAAGIAGLVAVLVRIMHDGYPAPSTFWWMMGIIILAGLLGGARIWLGRHTVWQVLAGFAAGFASVFLITMV